MDSEICEANFYPALFTLLISQALAFGEKGKEGEMDKMKQWLVRAFKGFTLIELLVVVIIIGILAAIGIPQYTKTIEKARGGEGRSGLGHIQEGEKLYYAEQEEYVAADDTDTINDNLDINITNRHWTFSIAVGNGGTTVNNQGFLATATRRLGRCQNYNMYIDHCGNLADHAADTYCSENEACDSCSQTGVDLWGDCVDDL